MMLTTKGRYAVMALADLATQESSLPVTLLDIGERQNIAVSYLEQIFSKLRKAGLVKSVRGPGGGYLLGRECEDICIADIISAVEESIKMTRCNHDPGNGCVAGTRCLTHDLWDGLGNHIYAYLQSITLSDICRRKVKTTSFFLDQSGEGNYGDTGSVRQ